MSQDEPLETVPLRELHDAGGARYLDANRYANGDITIEGQDLGPGVEEAFGPTMTEYEWEWRIEAANVPAAVAALGGQEGDDPLQVLLAWIGEHNTDPGNQIKEAGVPISFWNRIGD